MERQSRQVDVAEFISAREVGRYQVLIVILCLTVVVFDGYHTQAIGYVAPAKSHTPRGQIFRNVPPALLLAGGITISARISQDRRCPGDLRRHCGWLPAQRMWRAAERHRTAISR
jgi:hypothetical protein